MGIFLYSEQENRSRIILKNWYFQSTAFHPKTALKYILKQYYESLYQTKCLSARKFQQLPGVFVCRFLEESPDEGKCRGPPFINFCPKLMKGVHGIDRRILGSGLKRGRSSVE